MTMPGLPPVAKLLQMDLRPDGTVTGVS
jgi:hypothetical protein